MGNKANPRQIIELSGASVGIANGNITAMDDDSTGIATPALTFVGATTNGDSIEVSETGVYSIEAMFTCANAGDIFELHMAAALAPITVASGSGSAAASLRAAAAGIATEGVSLSWIGEIEAGQVVWFAAEASPTQGLANLNAARIVRLS